MRELYNKVKMPVKYKKRATSANVQMHTIWGENVQLGPRYTSWENATKSYSSTTKNKDEVFYKPDESHEVKQEINT